jgi:hypothetical protein
MLTSILLVAKLSLAAGPTQLSIDVKPAGSDVMLDGKKIGKSGDKPLTRTVTPGKHEVKAVYKGDSHTEEVPVKAGEKKSYSFEFEGVDSAPEPDQKKDKREGGEGMKTE